MKVTILGSGSYQPEYKRHSASHFVQIDKQNLVFDFGRGVLDQLQKSKVEYYQIDKIFISHLHSDHWSEIAPFLHIALAEPLTDKLRKKDITIYGPVGFKKAYNLLLTAFDLKKFNPKYKVGVVELKNNSVVKGKNWTIKSHLVKHSSRHKCLGYRLTSKGKVLAYSGDTEDCPGLRKACHQADLAIVETSWPEKLKPKGHMTGKSVGQMAEQEKIKKLVCTHMSPYFLKHFDVKKIVKKYYKGPVVIAKDLMEIII